MTLVSSGVIIQAKRESNPQPPVLETGALPIELLAYVCEQPLLAFFVNSMLALGVAILFQFDAIRVIALVFHGHVVFAFAAAANQSNLFAHNFNLA